MRKKPRVTWFVGSLGYGGNLLYWESILRRFVAAFPLTTILTARTSAEIEGTDIRVRRMQHGAALRIGSIERAVEGPGCLRELVRSRPDIVIASEFGLLSVYASIYRLFVRQSKLMLLVENHPRYLAGYGINRTTWIRRALRILVARASDLVLCNTVEAESYVVEELGVAESRVRCGVYLTSSIDVASSVSNVPGDSLYLLFVGQLINRKGVRYLIEAVNIAKKQSDRSIFLDIVGDGAERQTLERMVGHLGLQDTVTFHGEQPYSSLGKFFGHAGVFVFPTLGDYRALVGFEALSAGLAVIDSRFDGAAREVVQEARNGFVVDPREVEDFAEKILFFAKNPEQLRNFREQSKRLAARYRPADAADRLVGVCQEIASLDC